MKGDHTLNFLILKDQECSVVVEHDEDDDKRI